MTIANQPKEYHPALSGTIYRITKADPDAITRVEIHAGSGVPAVKRMSGMEEFTVDASPVILPNFCVAPLLEPVTGLYRASRTVSVRVVAGDRTALPVECLWGIRPGVEWRALTDAPEMQILNPGEIDEIAVIVSGELGIRLFFEGADPFSIEAESLSTQDIVVVVVNRNDLESRILAAGKNPGDYTSVRIALDLDGAPVLSRTYQLPPLPTQGVRTAWVNPYGMVDHYTFPVLLSESVTAGNKTVLALASAFEPAARMRQLAYMAASPKVWLIEGENAVEVGCSAGLPVVVRSGELSRMEITLTEA